MAERVFLHIGAPKTGTTYLQQVLYRNREALEAAGVLYPRVSGDAHHTALWDLREVWGKREFGQDIRGHWNRTVALVREWDGPTAVMSSELFVYAEPAICRRALSAFGDTEVHVVYTARDLLRQAPAVWQERVKNQHTLGYDEFLDDVLGQAKSSMAKGFWSAQDTPAALKRWSQGLPPGRVHVVTTPPSGTPPATLWRRFATVVGIDGRDYDTDVPLANTSMSVLAAEVLRRFNIRHGEQMTPLQYRRIVRRGLFERLAGLVSDPTRLTLTTQQRAELAKRGSEMAATISRRGYDVVGSLDELVPATSSRLPSDDASSQRRPVDVTDADVSDALMDVVDDLLRANDRRKQRRKAKRRSGKATRQGT